MRERGRWRLTKTILTESQFSKDLDFTVQSVVSSCFIGVQNQRPYNEYVFLNHATTQLYNEIRGVVSSQSATSVSFSSGSRVNRPWLLDFLFEFGSTSPLDSETPHLPPF